LARELEELRIVADQIGAPTSARSIAQALISILRDRGPHEHGSVINLTKHRFAEANGLVHLSDRGQASWHSVATAIVDGLRDRGQQLAVRNITAIGTKDFPTKAARPLNSRLDMTWLERIYHVQMPSWQKALNAELDEVAPGPDRAAQS
jgi:dTDP-4-dehydrorhamnose reductase